MHYALGIKKQSRQQCHLFSPSEKNVNHNFSRKSDNIRVLDLCAIMLIEDVTQGKPSTRQDKKIKKGDPE